MNCGLRGLNNEVTFSFTGETRASSWSAETIRSSIVQDFSSALFRFSFVQVVQPDDLHPPTILLQHGLKEALRWFIFKWSLHTW